MAPVHRFRVSLVALVASALLVSSSSFADEAPPKAPTKEPQKAGLNASELPPSAAKRAILDVQKRARDEKLPPAVLQRPLGEAIRAAERARGARDAGDAVHGTLLDKLAEQWASAGKTVLRAVQAERAAKKQTARLSELATKVKRAEALLHEQQARLGRLRAELKRLEDRSKDQQAAAAEAEKKRVGAGTKGKDAPPTKGKP